MQSNGVWEEFNEATKSVFRFAQRRFLQTVKQLSVGKTVHHVQGRWGAVDLDWRCRLHIINLSSTKETFGDSEVGSPISGAEVTKVIKKLYDRRTQGMDEIYPQFLKTLDVVGFRTFL